ncbi:MAG: HAMP domain-containing protein [Burkholderiales bacterium]|nr:HAMP domain-containing protein [Burkholderiales bacterium]
MPDLTRRASLAGHHVRWLVGVCLALCALTIATLLGFVMLPMAQRSADDLAGLMVLSAQTWAELPPDTRSAFEDELRRTHQLSVRPDMPAPPEDSLVHGVYLHFLERSLAQRDGASAQLWRATGPEPGEWLWTRVQAGGRSIGVGFPVDRLHTRPLWGLGVVLVGSVGLASLAAWWLARRIAQPVARLEQAAAELAKGIEPAMLSQSGPRELADLAGHFNHMARQVRELIDARTTLLAGLSHDLRTPLARMRLALELLRLQPTPALIDRLEQDIEAMNGLIGQSLDLVKGLAHEAPQPIDLLPWLRDRAQLHADEARSAGASLSVSADAGLQVHAAAGLLGRVVDNLLLNALRYAPGPVELSATRVTGTPSHHVRLAVADRGPGIPAAQLDTVWRPFQRVEDSRSPQTGGHGLGLAIVSQLARSQGWQVGLSTRDGGGLIAWVELPGG